MVKGISRQVIVVPSPDQKLFEQAIFILRDDAVKNGGISDEQLLREAKKAAFSSERRKLRFSGLAWACGGALATGLIWLLTTLL